MIGGIIYVCSRTNYVRKLNNKPQVWATVIEMLTLANSTDYRTIHVKALSNKLWLCLNGSKHNEPQFEVLNGSVVLRVIFTISDDKEDEGFVAEQPENGSCIGVALRRDLPSRGLRVGGRDLRTLLKHWQEHKTQNTNSSNYQNSSITCSRSALIWVQFHCVTGHTTALKLIFGN